MLGTTNSERRADCEVCRRIALITRGAYRFFVKEMETGYVVLGDYQFFRGYTLFICRPHYEELHDLEPSFRLSFLREMSVVSEAVHRVFRPHKLNLSLSGNIARHLHWHIFPRYSMDPAPNAPAWVVPKELRLATRPSSGELQAMRQSLLTALQDLSK